MKELFANLVIYRSNVQTIHWKLFGRDFIDVHEFTDKMYSEINEFIDRIAEKFIQKDVELDTTLEYLFGEATISEEKGLRINVNEGVDKLVRDGETLLAQTTAAYETIQELGAMDVILDDLRDYLEKTNWILKKNLEK